MLEAKNLSFGNHLKLLLDNINLIFQPGHLYGLLGPNGSGKSSLLKILSGIWKPTSGVVLWKGENLLNKQRKEISRLISLVPQNPPIPFDFTAREIVAMGRYPHGQSGKTKYEKELIDEAIALVDGVSLSSKKMCHLSVGERQRLYIARALVTESPVLLLDEPTACLDIRHEIEIWSIILRLLKQGKIVIVAIHNLLVAKKFCKYLVILKEGKNKGFGLTEEILTPPLLQDIYGIDSIHSLYDSH